MSPRGALRAYAELTRPPALCTAPADAVTGLALTLAWAGAPPGALRVALHGDLPPAALASVCLYAAGMITNDLFDAALDARERPERPLPSGRASARRALALALALQAAALALGAAESRAALAAVALTALTTYLYNGLLKGGALAPLGMAACRVGNLWVGVAWGAPVAVWGAGGGGALGLTAVVALYVAALTALAGHEVHGGARARPLAALLVAASLGPLAPALAALSRDPLSALLAAALALALARSLTPPLRATLAAPSAPARAGAARQMVGAGVRGVALLNAALCAGLGAWGHAAVLLVLSVCARRVGRWFYAT